MPETLKKLIEAISYLPGIGEKTATKLAFFLLQSHANYNKNLSELVAKIQTDIIECPTCGSLMETGRVECNICSDASRDQSTICVVEDYLDLASFEKTSVFRGRYHVLGGSISPVHGRHPEDLRFASLFDRARNGTIREIIIATNPNIEGEATALYAIEHLNRPGLKISRLSRGLPNAGYIEYVDEITLINAFKGRTDVR